VLLSPSPGTIRVAVVGSSSSQDGVYLYTVGLFKGAYTAGLPLSFEWMVQQRPATKDLPPNVEIQKAWKRGPLAMFRIWKSLRRSRVRVVHVQYEYFLYANGISAFAVAVSLGLLKLVGGLRRFKFAVTIHQVVPLSSAGRSLSSQFFIPGIPTLLMMPLLILVTRILSYSSDVLVVHLQTFASVLTQVYKVGRNKIVVIPHGVAGRDGVSTGGTDVIFFGQVTPRKGIETLLEAFDGLPLPGVRLMIIGGPHRRNDVYLQKVKLLASQSRKSDLVSVTGFVNESELSEFFQGAAVVVLPYHSLFSASGALAYALGFAKPVIVTPLQAFREMLADAGIYVEADPHKLSLAISRVLTDREYASDYSERVRQRARQMSWETSARMTMIEYLKLLGARNG
jgi:glycosyltransferase involved in cell wall biosynthesis